MLLPTIFDSYFLSDSRLCSRRLSWQHGEDVRHHSASHEFDDVDDDGDEDDDTVMLFLQKVCGQPMATSWHRA